MTSKNRTAGPFSLIKLFFFLFMLFHLLKSFSPPALNGQDIQSAEMTTLPNLLAHLDRYAGQPVVVGRVRVINPCHFYLGSFYYIESLDGNSRLLVLSRKFPPKEGNIIKVLGIVQPVISVNNVNLAFFKEAAIEEITPPSDPADRISLSGFERTFPGSGNSAGYFPERPKPKVWPPNML